MRLLRPPTWHPELLACLALAVVAYAVATSHAHHRAHRRQWIRLVVAVVLIVAVCGWPLGDLAAHVSISALVVQRLVLMLAVAPLLVASLPDDLAAAISRPRALDWVLVKLSHPAIAMATVTLVGTVTLLPLAVTAGSDHLVVRGVLAAVTVGIGVVLWLPMLSSFPGRRTLSHVAKAGYMFASSLVVTSLSFVWIFTRHPLYPSLMHQEAILGMSAVVDQQLAGFISKLGAYAPMWTIAFVMFAKVGESGEEVEQPMRWVDVQRELERAARSPGPDPDDVTPT